MFVYTFTVTRIALLLMLLSQLIFAKEPLVVPLWPHGVPGSKATLDAERDTTTSRDHQVAGKAVVRLGNITEPTLTMYFPSQGVAAKSAILVFPGGGYRILAMDLEGTEVCHWLNSIGIVAGLVKYRVPEPAGAPRYAAPLQDAERAISLVRKNARTWNVDPAQVGVLGFSAGGHLAAALSYAAAAERTYPKVDAADSGDLRPAFAVLVYPAYLSVNDAGNEVAPEVAPSHRTPPTFLVQAEDDHAFIDGSLLYYRALKRAGVPAELHVFSRGGHGYGLRRSSDRVTGWPALVEGWLQSLR